MAIKFPYLKREEKHYPIVPIILRYRDKFVLTDALVDSGANTSVFHAKIADRLNLDFKKGGKIYLGGVGGRILAYLQKLNIQIQSINFICKIAFTEEMPVSLNILGRDNFFKKFIVSFNENKKQVILKN